MMMKRVNLKRLFGLMRRYLFSGTYTKCIIPVLIVLGPLHLDYHGLLCIDEVNLVW